MSTDHVNGVAAVTAQSAKTLRALATKCASLEDENKGLREKVAAYERAERVRKIASQMEERGLSPELSYPEKIASISKYTDLDRVEEAIKLAGGGRLDLAQVAETKSGVSSEDVGLASFATFCMTGQGAQ